PESVMRGGVDVRKIDAETGNVPQGDAALAGAVLDIVNLNENPVVVDGGTYAEGEVCKSITVEYDEGTGTYVASCRDCLPYGSYEIHESAAPEGYLLTAGWTQEFSIEKDGDVADLTAEAKALSDDVIRGGVRVEKDDKELGKSEAIGGKDHASTEGACLSGIEFTIVNQSERAVVVSGELFEPGDVVETIETAWNGEIGAYVAETPSDELPYGTYTIQETASNESYLLTDGKARTFQIREDGKVVEADAQGAGLVFSDQVIRNDMELSKKADDSNAAIQAAFLVTNTETGEAHVLVCDRNGDASTAAGWNPHTRNTNANDKLAESETVKSSDFDTSAGIWFGLGEDGSMAEPDDSLGAMPYGHYTIEELRSDSNAGYELVERELWIARDTTVARAVWMSLDDQPSERIRTQAADASDGDSYVDAAEQVTIKDTVFYENLRTDGREYTVEGALMLKSENKPLLDAEGNPVTASRTFKPTASSGTVELEFTFDASLLAGETVVVFEDLLQDGKLVATHADINDEGQSVKVVRIRTTTTNETGGKTVTGTDVAIVDEVAYEGLTPGETYTLKATLM
ncbi:MAG: VaFE repeat-containing surface-anchored protein, partial [Atopobiaceae bacterium]|nr:VaFE repeat-containing surface-anchored protein [Atopobiaceae bacterium]